AALQQALQAAAADQLFVLQVGECAERFAEANPLFVRDKLLFYEQLAETLAIQIDRPVLLIGRLAGQFAKPRSQAFEDWDARRVLTYRGDMVHGEDRRVPDPQRMLMAYDCSSLILEEVARRRLQGPSSRLA